MTILDRTKEVAKLRGLSLTETAIKAGLADKSIYSWDRSSPKSENLEKVANVLNVSTDYLLGRTDDMHLSDSTHSNTADLAKEGVFLYNGKEIDDDEMKIIKSLMESWDNK